MFRRHAGQWFAASQHSTHPSMAAAAHDRWTHQTLTQWRHVCCRNIRCRAKIRKHCSSSRLQRNEVETKMSCITQLDESVTPCTFNRQANELDIRTSVLSSFAELGHPQTAFTQQRPILATRSHAMKWWRQNTLRVWHRRPNQRETVHLSSAI